MFQASQDPGKEAPPAVGHLAVCAAWAAVTLFFGWKEYMRQHQLEDAVLELARSIGPRASAEILGDLHAVAIATARPDWTVLAVLAMIISLRSMFSAIGCDRLTSVNARIGSLLRRL